VLVAPAVLAASLAALAGGVYYAVLTRPKADVAGLIEAAAELAEKGEYVGALEELNSKVVPAVNAGLGTEGDIARFYTLRARSLYEAAAAERVEREENFRAVLQDYAAARKHGAKLEPGDVIRLATSRMELNQVDESLKEADALPASEAEARRRLVKMGVMRGIAEPKRYFDRTLGLLVELAQQPGISSEEAAWALSRQGELLIGAGRGKEAITKILREMQLIRDMAPAQEAELSELLGRAYSEQGELAEAGRQLEHAVALAEPASELRAAAMVELGEIRQATGKLDEAKELFAAALQHVSSSRAYLAALMGRASVAAAQGDDEAALRDYAELVEKLPKEKASGLLSPESIADGLMAEHSDRLLAGKTRQALRYAVLAESLFAADKVPANILLALSASNRRLADELMGREPDATNATQAVGAKPIEEVDSVTREEAKRCYLAAGSYYSRHADAVVVEDPDSATKSRWMSADSYDLAGDTGEATRAFSAYLQGAPGQDSRRQEAKFRLARVFQSIGDFGTAASLYRDLLDERANAGDRGGMVWADRSIVPLAQCYLADGDPGNDADAERELLGVLGGREFSPQAEEFREALLELGRAYYGSGRYAPAIERLREFEARYPGDEEIQRVRFRLADSERLSAEAIEKSLELAMPQAQHEELEKTRDARLREAMGLFERVKDALAARKPESLGAVERIHLRNSIFYLGDCAYELGDYNAAISYYDAARQQYDSDPASLVALVQIVNAYVQQGEWAKAVTANERARQHLAKFPESVWSDPDLPMDKRHWERWLDSKSLLEQHARAEATGQ
jgi:tetratricopeptide (TPR) repeat protein